MPEKLKVKSVPSTESAPLLQEAHNGTSVHGGLFCHFFANECGGGIDKWKYLLHICLSWGLADCAFLLKQPIELKYLRPIFNKESLISWAKLNLLCFQNVVRLFIEVRMPCWPICITLFNSNDLPFRL